jgi:nucleoid DNA-binding protein
MTKKELISKVAAETRVTQEDTRMMLDALLDAIADCLVQGDHICLHQLGTFSVQTIPEHRTNLPGNAVLPETKKVKLKMSSELKERLDSSISRS